MSNVKDCPYCGEEILVKAIKCKHCFSMLDDKPAEDLPPGFSSHTSDSNQENNPSKSMQPPSVPPPPSPADAAGAGQSSAPPPPPGMSDGNITMSPPPGPPQGPPPPPPGGGMNNPAKSVPGNPSTNSAGGLAELGNEMMTAEKASNYSKAALGKRLIAYIIDGIIASIPLIILIPIALMPIFRYIESGGWITPSGFEWVLGILGIIIGLGWAFIYTLLRDGFGNGQSFGKRMFGLMVVRLNDKQPCSKMDSLKRNIVAIALGIVLSWIPLLNFFASFVEPIVGAVDKKGMRIGDRFAKTQVIATDEFR